MRPLRAAAFTFALLAGCTAGEIAPHLLDAGTDAGHGGSGGSAADAGDDAEPPVWLGDAGLLPRAPVPRPLHELCGLASNPGDLPLGDDPAAAALRAGYFDAALDLGGVMIRRDVRWNEVEPTQGNFDFARHDALVMEAEQRGVRLLATLDYGALWAHPGAKDIFYPPDDPADFGAYAGVVAARYQGRFVGYEIWNEPNGGFRFWKPTLSGDPAAYAALLGAASAAIKGADPATPVLLGGTVFTPQLIEGAMAWLGEAYAADPALAQRFDVAGVHTYQLYPPTTAPEVSLGLDPPLADKLSMHSWLLAQHGGAGKPMWITELGWPVMEGQDEAAQARFTVRATILAAQAGAGGIFWYTLRDGPDPTAFPPEDAFGLLHHDADPVAQKPSPKLVYTALKALLATVGERWPEAADPALATLPADVRAVTFAGTAPGKVHALWTVSGAAATLPAPMDGELREQDGSLRATVKKGATVALSGDVTYLR